MISANHAAYDELPAIDLSEFRCTGRVFRHRATGCEIFKIQNDDRENSFAFAFRTPSENARGTAHIVEHSVLCGSRRYPAKDPFLIMAGRSLATYLNALTYPDKTVYPAASAVKADFYNLLDVYGDAVFYPNLSRETFLQEAFHYEYTPAGKLDIQGVVYNEMRGDYSSSESLMSTYLTTSIFGSGHPYSFDSGGNPESIIDLSYDEFVSFWRRHYSPANCRIGLYGDIPVEEELEFLDRRFLAPLSEEISSGRLGSSLVDNVPPAAPWQKPRSLRFPLPVSDSEGSQVLVSWLLHETDPVESMAFDMISELLLGHDGAPLAKALQNCGLGEDISPLAGTMGSHRQMIFSAGLRGIRDTRAEAQVEDLILDTIRDYAARGIDPDEFETALHSMTFYNREIRRGFSTYGLRLLLLALNGWLRGESPESRLLFRSASAGLKSRMAANSRYLESLIEEQIIQNSHRLTLCAYPDTKHFAQLAEQNTERLALKDRTLTADQKAAIRADSLRLAEASRRPDPPEVLASFPSIKPLDIPHEIDCVPRETGSVRGIPLSSHPIFTNGIVYLDMAFSLQGLEDGAFDWLPLLCHFIEGCGTKRLSYDQAAAGLARNSGGFGLGCEAAIDRLETTRAFTTVRIKALEERFDAAANLAFELLCSPDFSDLKRLSDLLVELGNTGDAAIISEGSSFAAQSASSGFNRACAINERLCGLSQILFLRRLRESLQAEKHLEPAHNAGLENAASILESLARGIFTQKRLRLSLTASPDCLDSAEKSLEKYVQA